MGDDDDWAPPALLTPSGGVRIREQDAARVQATPPSYSGYSSVASLQVVPDGGELGAEASAVGLGEGGTTILYGCLHSES